MAEAEWRRFGPGRVWLAVLALDLAMSAEASYIYLEVVTDGGVSGAFTGPYLSWTALDVLLIGSVLGTWWAVGRRANHPQTVRAGIAVAVIRLILMSFPVALQLSMERCGC
ncbi:hypothetical protein [Streptomyces rhizosphaerihabitans]|uniref:hypothetical protein n=1 Tax=Streptomyces rhizosphaerihabitans TaxID=1266770 RepID=UPI0021BE9BC1|nr:hypothetical protein [Streptomyces rhizosphaerihabitans]MCT9010557.1 hypothetical protein [Streptomyces rhizosphaerihabitans]